jgi:hypothetical protein
MNIFESPIIGIMPIHIDTQVKHHLIPEHGSIYCFEDFCLLEYNAM